jgi:hypothetical protein
VAEALEGLFYHEKKDYLRTILECNALRRDHNYKGALIMKHYAHVPTRGCQQCNFVYGRSRNAQEVDGTQLMVRGFSQST